ncbi:MAG TPA: TM2 domain-containing protein, partial [Clostridia bacterium]|nr:TM2 domain-containing protein [Clostridia bacterium]
MKNKYIAALLAIFLGLFGVHKFYLGQKTAGIVYLIFFWTGIPEILGII